MIDGALHHEAVVFVDAVRDDPGHPARAAIDAYLARLADNLQHDPDTRTRLEQAKGAVFDSPRIRELAARIWETAKAGLLEALADPASGLRTRLREALVDIGGRLSRDAGLQRRVDGWVVDAASFLVERYRHDIASIITDTVDRWDPEETTEKIELLVGRTPCSAEASAFRSHAADRPSPAQERPSAACEAGAVPMPRIDPGSATEDPFAADETTSPAHLPHMADSPARTAKVHPCAERAVR
jgi:hypothetical protein